MVWEAYNSVYRSMFKTCQSSLVWLLVLLHSVLCILEMSLSHRSNIIALFSSIWGVLFLGLWQVGLWQLNVWERNINDDFLKAGHIRPTCVKLRIDSTHVWTSVWRPIASLVSISKAVHPESDLMACLTHCLHLAYPSPPYPWGNSDFCCRLGFILTFSFWTESSFLLLQEKYRNHNLVAQWLSNPDRKPALYLNRVTLLILFGILDFSWNFSSLNDLLWHLSQCPAFLVLRFYLDAICPPDDDVLMPKSPVYPCSAFLMLSTSLLAFSAISF